MTKATILSNSHQKQPKRSRPVREYGDDDDYYTYHNIVVMNKHLLPTPGSVTRIDRKDVEEVIESVTTIRTKNCNKCSPDDVHCALGVSFWGKDDEDKEYKNNLNQVVASGRILDQDTLRVSQIKQNDNHQTNRHPNRRPWNHAKRFLSSYQPSE